ncbi:MAG TPA: dihydrolipoamide acetyltransferase family protein [Dehalococcoidia bacterium]|nr:dihydrolipoamide acetyltransferase family protein [Dehalococcoidia bacterium]
MITKITMPSMGADMTEGTIVKWLKQEDEKIEKGDKLAEIETDKTVVEMEAYGAGYLRKIVIPEGEKVPVGTVIGFMGEMDDEIPEIKGNPVGQTETVQESSPQPSSLENNSSNSKPTIPDSSGRVKASPIARKLAEELGVNLGSLSGSGPGGRITKEDVEAASGGKNDEVDSDVEGNLTPLSSMRKTIASVTVRSKTEAPHFYITTSVNMTKTLDKRKEFNDQSDVHVSVNDLIIFSTVNALKRFPKFNSSFQNDNLMVYSQINIGIAIALQSGLIVPALIDCQDKSLKEISSSAKDLGNRAKGNGGSLSQEENTSGTFSISNLGIFDVENFTAIIVPPQAAILATGKIAPTPVVDESEIVISQEMKATLSVDHRVADGAEAALFLGEIKSFLENPDNLFS